MKVRELTHEGVDAFERHLQNLRDGGSQSLPDLNKSPYSVLSDINVNIDENRTFKTRIELGEYIEKLFTEKKIQRSSVIERTDMWSWLAYVWLDQLLDGKTPKESAWYICSSAYNRYYRHVVASSYYILSIHGKENSRIFLDRPLTTRGELAEQFASRQHIISSVEIVKVISMLYWDKKTQSIKPKAASKGIGGTSRRFGSILNQLILTYDLHGMDPAAIIKILPKEFDKWKN